MERSGSYHDRRLSPVGIPADAADRHLRFYEEFEPIDVFGFAEAFTIARFLGNGYGDPPPYPVAVTLIGCGRDGVKSANGPVVLPDLDMDQAADDPPEVLMIPGGGGTWPLLDAKAEPQRVAALLDLVQRMDGKVNLMTSVCTGAAVLARAGLLDGRPAATNQGAFAWLTEQGPKVLWDSVSRGARRRPLHDIRRGLRGSGPRLLYWSRGSPAVAENAVMAAEYDWRRDPQFHRLPAAGGGLIAADSF